MDFTRQELHVRRIECRGFRRSDGLWDIEGTLRDNKTYPFELGDRGTVTPDDPVHEMSLRLTFDEEMTIRDVGVVMAKTPYAICPCAAAIMPALIGVRIGVGWLGEVRKRLPRTERCTHLYEMLPVLATAAWQTMSIQRKKPSSDPAKIDTCYAYEAERLRLRTGATPDPVSSARRSSGDPPGRAP